ncbi:unnamed protein product [Amoebophrya sp. A25]|nr:unnamed protein product [Amoebophrya sp. A25]|eukprot:GSA25T00009962001.1
MSVKVASSPSMLRRESTNERKKDLEWLTSSLRTSNKSSSDCQPLELTQDSRTTVGNTNNGSGIQLQGQQQYKTAAKSIDESRRCNFSLQSRREKRGQPGASRYGDL